MNKCITNPHLDFIISKSTVVCVDITLQQQKDSVVVVMLCSDQKEGETKEDKVEFGIKIDS